MVCFIVKTWALANISIRAPSSLLAPLCYDTTLRASLEHNIHQMLHSHVNAHSSVCNYVSTPPSLALFTHCWNTEPEPRRRWAIVPSPLSVSRPGSKFITSFWGFCRAAALAARRCWTGVSVFVPDTELEIRARRLCTCSPFTSHLCLTGTLPLRHSGLFACAELKQLQGRVL